MSRASVLGKNQLTSPAIEQEGAINRIQYIAVSALAVITVLALAWYAALALGWREQPFLGAMVSQTQVVTPARPVGNGIWAGLEAGLKSGDVITAINGEALNDSYSANRGELAALLQGKNSGDEVEVTYLRDGQPNTARVTLWHLPDADFLAFFALPYGSGIVAMVIGLLVLAFRPKNAGALNVAALCFLTALGTGGMFDLATTTMLVPLWVFSMAAVGGMAFYFGLTFPSPMPLVYRLPRIEFVPLVLALIAGVIGAVLATAPSQPQDYVFGYRLATITTIIGIIGLATCMFFQNKDSASATTRDQSGVILMGVLLAFIPAVFFVVGGIIRQVFPSFVFALSLETMAPFTIPLVMALAYSVFQYNYFNTDKLISQSMTYSLLLVGLALGYFLLVLGASLFASRGLETLVMVNASDPLLIAVTMFVVAALFIPVRTRLQEQIDRLYFRQRRNYQEKLEDFGRGIGSLSGYEDTIEAFRRTVNETINPINILIFMPNDEGGDFVAYGKETDIRFTADSGVVTLLKKNLGVVYLQPGQTWPTELFVDKARLSILKTMVLSGIISNNNQLNSFISIGAPRSGRPTYAFEELRFLNSIIAQMSVALERAQVVNSLEKRVREQDVLSQVGQAVNFTIEFDDLLELISAQTAKLINAPHFYIALYDQTPKQLYFAFCLEDDERYEDRENIRWPLGNDLFSEIVRTGQSKRVEDYEKITAQGGFDAVYSSEHVRAWMGVPLIAQTRTLGVMAVGRSKEGEIFTADQLKIFSDVGALAATSLEKARLFNEVNVRARQLGALNDISRKLVAAESSDVESLLHLITASAVEILNAEAGSLLLAADDGTGDMIFRVTVGGGEDGVKLVGTRLKSGHGLVGEVTKSGQPVIVNNARQDDRWKGEVVKDGFKTSSILAVPLIAKEQIIGVLEILNKKDGTIYAAEESELLTTFAGQAAIAIENARLIEITGSQLTKRLQELETLERIDTELNRTLDIHRVAEITVKWAIANSNATAGALGLVEGTALRIIAAQGYSPDDFPPGWDRNRWPLDQGILRRVMRFRVADLVPDVRIDPDYKQSLKDALSQITVPMMSGDEVNAVLVLETNKEPRFNLLDLDFVQRLAEHASIAISNAQLYEEIRRAAETKSEFVGFAAHELKNPLTSIMGYSGALMGQMASAMSEDMKRNALNVILSNAKSMESIINDLRDIAAGEADKLHFDIKSLALMDVVAETLPRFEQQVIDKQQTVVNEVTDELPHIMADSSKLVQVMVNLVSNAHKYSPEGSTIEVKAHVIPNYRNARGQALGPMMYIAVKDNGIGMSEEDLSRIFRENYFRSDNPKAKEQKGTGLGMMVTQMFVEKMGGHIWVTSKLGEGSTFQFVLPLAPKTQPEPASD